MERLSERKRHVLYAVVRDYIVSAAPVGSGQVSRKKGIELSPATVRTVMSELKERGFLRRSHVSAGCVPTSDAYQFYVDELMKLRPLSATEQEEIRRRVRAGGTDLQEIVKDACRWMSLKAHQPGVALQPRADERSLRHIQFIALKEKLALAILVSGFGVVENKILKLDRRVSQEELNRMQNYLNDRLAGRTLAAIRKEVLLEMKQIQSEYDEVLQRALVLADQALTEEEPDVMVQGRSLLLGEPEFASLERMAQILRTLEEKTLLVRLLDQSLAGPGVKIFIGGDQRFPEINGLTLITSAYSDSEGNRGVLGVLGPSRMDYARIVPLVDFTSQLVTNVLKEKAQ